MSSNHHHDDIPRIPYGSLDDSMIPPARANTKAYHHHQQPHHTISSSNSNSAKNDYCEYNHDNDDDDDDNRKEGAIPQRPRHAYIRDDSSYSYHHYDNSNHHGSNNDASVTDNDDDEEGNDIINNNKRIIIITCCQKDIRIRIPTIRQLALSLSLYANIGITISKLIAYIQTNSLSVLAALLDSVLDVVSQAVLNYTEHRSSHLNHDDDPPDGTGNGSTSSHNHKRSSAYYPAGASRLEPIGVLTCAALMGMASFEVLKQSTFSLLYPSSRDMTQPPQLNSVYNMVIILCIKIALLLLCRRGANKRYIQVDDENINTQHQKNNNEDIPIIPLATTTTTASDEDDLDVKPPGALLNDEHQPLLLNEMKSHYNNTPQPADTTNTTTAAVNQTTTTTATTLDTNVNARSKQVIQFADPTLEALSQDHYNDCLSNAVAAISLLCTYYSHDQLWFVDPVGAIVISIYIIYSWYMTGKEQIEHLTGRSAPAEFIQELIDMANEFDERITVDTVRAYHFGPKFLVEIEIVMNATTLLFESHDLGMDLQYEIEGREEVERCFVHIDYQARPYDEHVVSKVPELREKFNINKQPSVKQMRSTQSI